MPSHAVLFGRDQLVMHQRRPTTGEKSRIFDAREMQAALDAEGLPCRWAFISTGEMRASHAQERNVRLKGL